MEAHFEISTSDVERVEGKPRRGPPPDTKLAKEVTMLSRAFGAAGPSN